jgi:diaminopimelate decarboxylase
MKRIIQNGHLYWDGCDTVSLAEQFGTPLYVFSENDMIHQCQTIQHDFLKKYPNTRAAFASKAFCTLAMVKLIEQQGLGLDVVSAGELYTAIKAEFPAERIEMNGNNKSIDELEMAIEYGVGRIIIDGLQELPLIEALCREKNKKMNVLYRITPEVKAATHSFISTGQKDSKFGIPIDEDILFPAIQAAIDSEWVNFLGFHFHVGSQLFTNDAHLKAVEVATNLMLEVRDRFHFDVQELNYGGGFGVHYTAEDQPKSFGYFTDAMMEKTIAFCDANDFAVPAVVIEPGRSIVAEAGISLHTIGSIKNLPGIRKYVAIDGGMTDNIRPGLYGAKYEGLLANKADQQPTETVTIAGKACESTDILVKDIKLPEACAGDIFATFSTGAYGYAMASNYNKLPIPAVVFVKDGHADLVVKRQSLAQMIQNEQIPENLK